MGGDAVRARGQIGDRLIRGDTVTRGRRFGARVTGCTSAVVNVAHDRKRCSRVTCSPSTRSRSHLTSCPPADPRPSPNEDGGICLVAGSCGRELR